LKFFFNPCRRTRLQKWVAVLRRYHATRYDTHGTQNGDGHRTQNRSPSAGCGPPGSGVCSGSPISPPVAPVDGVDDEREGGWMRKMAREREMLLGETFNGCWGELLAVWGGSIRFGEVNYKITLPLFEKKNSVYFFLGIKFFPNLKMLLEIFIPNSKFFKIKKFSQKIFSRKKNLHTKKFFGDK